MEKINKFLIQFTNYEATAIVEYNEQGYLISYELESGRFQKEQFDFFIEYLPKKRNHLDKWKDRRLQNTIIKEYDYDLTFENFYNRYDYKVSKRKLCENIWKKLTKLDKIKAIAYIPKYESHLIRTGINKKYPETYLRSEIWKY